MQKCNGFTVHFIKGVHVFITIRNNKVQLCAKFRVHRSAGIVATDINNKRYVAPKLRILATERERLVRTTIHVCVKN